MDKIKKNKELIIAPLLTALILLLVYAVKHIYPFGGRDIAYYDMNQSFVPLYTRAWDILHGRAHWLYDWYTGSGNAISGITSNFLISPFNLFFLFVKREYILESMSFYLMIKLMFASVAMAFYTKKAHGLSCAENIAAALIYSFSGYVVQYYTNIQFLDTVAFFPLLM
ncbi:MAG: YfhO family protein, partial [Firmicutes bacterium]|nr:YfhO family protein [Bacillota bacterium]